jgi:DNA invertase Pin-like site-specific DNA recombinase
MLAYSYRRFSSGKQAQGTSLERQAELAEKYCRRRGWQLDTNQVLTDRAVSAFRGKNAATGALAAFLAAVKEGTIRPGSALIVESLDRLTRQAARQALTLFSQLLDAGITIVTLSPEREYVPEATNDLFDLLEPLLVMSRAHEESQMKSKRVADVWDRRRRAAASRPVSPLCPAWLKYRDGCFVPVPAMVRAVQRIFNAAAAGVGTSQILRELQAERVPSLSAKGWSYAAVHYLLTNRAVVGEFQPHRRQGNKRIPVGAPVERYYPPIVTAATFAAVQGRLTLQRGFGRKGNSANGVPSLFTGLLWDHATGSSLVYTDGMLAPRRAKATGRRQLGFNSAAFEAGFIGFVGELLLPVRVETDRRAEAAAQLAGVRADKAKLLARIEANPDLDDLLDVLRNLKRAEQAAKERCEREEAAAQRDEVGDLSALRQLLKVLKDGTAEERMANRARIKGRIRALVSEIWVRVESESRYHRRVLAQVVLRAGGWRWFEVETNLAKSSPLIRYVNNPDVGNLSLIREKRADL